MYHYAECGLRNVWLANGYRTLETEYGSATSIEDVDGLHRAIGARLARHKPKLTGSEFRFLRKELGLSQAKFGQSFDLEAQSVALWERKGRVPTWADRIIRQLYLESVAENTKIKELIERLNDLDRQEHENERQIFQETDKGWAAQAA